MGGFALLLKTGFKDRVAKLNFSHLWNEFFKIIIEIYLVVVLFKRSSNRCNSETSVDESLDTDLM